MKSLRKRTLSRNATDGFTLLELLVATAITLVLATLVITVATGALRLVRRSEGNLTADATAQSIFNLLERDLQSALYRLDGGAWLAVDVLPDATAVAHHGWLTTAVRLKPAGSDSNRVLSDPTAPDIALARFGFAGAWLRLATTNVETAGSLPVVVSYQIVRRPVTGSISADNLNAASYTLYRAAVSSDQTLVNGCSVTAAAYQSSSTNPAGTRAPTTVTNPNREDALANNVVDFGVWFYARNPDGTLRRIFPANENDTSHTALGVSNPADANRFPSVVDVMVRILSEEGAALIESMEAGRIARPGQFSSDGEWWWAVTVEHSQVFCRRISISGVAP